MFPLSICNIVVTVDKEIKYLQMFPPENQGKYTESGILKMRFCMCHFGMATLRTHCFKIY